MKIKVTEYDIAHGKRGICDKCPIALAMGRAGLKYPKAFPHTLYWKAVPRGRYSSTKAPPEAILFMVAFDCKEAVQPFEFAIL